MCIPVETFPGTYTTNVSLVPIARMEQWSGIYVYICMYACMHVCILLSNVSLLPRAGMEKRSGKYLYEGMYVCLYVCLFCMYAVNPTYISVCIVNRFVYLRLASEAAGYCPRARFKYIYIYIHIERERDT